MRCFAIIPAAGLSVRMGRPKLLLPWGDSTVIEQVLATWRASLVHEIVIVARRADDELARVVSGPRTSLVTPDIDPPEMKASIRHALDFIETQRHPQPTDAWLLAPADMPQLSTAIINRLIAEYRQSPRNEILVPSVQTHRAHPVLFPWSLASAVAKLGENEGLNSLVARSHVKEIPCEDSRLLRDLDTPEDYETQRPK